MKTTWPAAERADKNPHMGNCVAQHNKMPHVDQQLPAEEWITLKNNRDTESRFNFPCLCVSVKKLRSITAQQEEPVSLSAAATADLWLQFRSRKQNALCKYHLRVPAYSPAWFLQQWILSARSFHRRCTFPSHHFQKR